MIPAESPIHALFELARIFLLCVLAYTDCTSKPFHWRCFVDSFPSDSSSHLASASPSCYDASNRRYPAQRARPVRTERRAWAGSILTDRRVPNRFTRRSVASPVPPALPGRTHPTPLAAPGTPRTPAGALRPAQLGLRPAGPARRVRDHRRRCGGSPLRVPLSSIAPGGARRQDPVRPDRAIGHGIGPAQCAAAGSSSRNTAGHLCVWFSERNEEAVVFCDRCGTNLSPGGSFCPTCGKAAGTGL